MGPQSDFRVVIGGGGITGLALANMLQLYGIDFVLLEANTNIATSQVCAGINLLPHGNRIMDQLGLYDKLSPLAAPVDSLHFRDEFGKVIRQIRGVNQSIHER
jgi:2-polyprenyl-6-methoxyphenol hydroxylase-like FAD-dependent oxidoreductase